MPHLEGHLGGSVQRPTLAQVMISQFMSLRLVSASLLSAQSLLWILHVRLLAPPSLSHVLYISSKINKLKKKLSGHADIFSLLLNFLVKYRNIATINKNYFEG